MIDLDDKYIVFIKSTVQSFLPDCRVYLFGSRTKGTAKKYSDADIALDSPILNESILCKIKNEFENSTIPYEVDVIDINNISDRFLEQIKNDLTEI